MWSYHVILLFSYLVPSQPYYCRLWFFSAVKLNLSSSGLDEGSPRETHREDSNELLVGNVPLFLAWQLGDTSDKRLFNTNHGTWHGRWAVCELWLQRWVSVWMKRADRALSALLLVFPTVLEEGNSLLIPCAFHYTQDHYGRDRAVCYNLHLTPLLSFLPPL